MSVLDRHNVIWIGADRAGNSAMVGRRVLFAMLAPSAARTQYRIEDERIYITGLSGGGKTASMIATDQAQLFRGAIYVCGVERWDREPERLEQIRNNHYVFVTGTYDQALEPTKRAFRAYRKAGIENSKLMVIRNMTHRNPDSYDFEEALAYLDSRMQPGH
jgi:predicted peptidase